MWIIAAIQTVIVIVLKKIEGDILSGVCFVGLWDSSTLLWFVIVPQGIYLIVGVVFLILGQISLCRVRSEQCKNGSKTDKLECLMCRIGKKLYVFKIIYILKDLRKRSR